MEKVRNVFKWLKTTRIGQMVLLSSIIFIILFFKEILLNQEIDFLEIIRLYAVVIISAFIVVSIFHIGKEKNNKEETNRLK